MRKLSIAAFILSVLFNLSCSNAKNGKEKNSVAQKITFIENTGNNSIEVFADGKPFTTFRWPDNICKPVLYPVFAASGTEVTRGFPLLPKTGEMADHPHQIGVWLTYGNVNGTDFWGNGSQGLGTRNSNGGIIKHLKIEKTEEGQGRGVLVSEESWIDSSGVELLKENTEYHFIANGTTRIIDRVTKLTAVEKEVVLTDTKEGMFAIRVARQLELPSKGQIEMVSADGSVSKLKDTLNIGITGNYTSSEGISGEAVWGTRARWMKLNGKIGDGNISVVICDHAKNPNYPTYWHARGYGLFSANPLGVRDFTKGKENLNFTIAAGQSATFRYRVIIHSGSEFADAAIEKYYSEFESKF
jgi:hypothetical protein